MKFAINPTRMELLKLKNRLKTAVRGYKLLREKRDGLMKHFMRIIKEAKILRKQIDQDLASAFRSFVFATAQMPPEITQESLAWPNKKIELSFSRKNIMGVNIPQFSIQEKGEIFCYSLVTTSQELDTSLNIFDRVLKDLIKLAEIEQGAKLLANEIEKTRRRVNALEHILIPNLKETIKYIDMKLNEQERSAIAGLIRIKEIIS